jgi:hypothetical protein
MRITKLVAAFIGVPMVIGSFALAVGGGIALAVPDDDGWISTHPLRLTTDAVALVGEDIEIDLGDHFDDGRTFIGWEAIPARLEATSRSGKSVFVGITRETDANAYLAGVSTTRVMSFDDDPELRYRDGVDSVAPPSTRDIWVASSIDDTLEWDVSDGEWAIVVLNNDGSAGVDVSLTGSARIPFLTGIGVILIAVGLIGMTLGSLLTYYGVRRVREPRSNTPPPSQSQPVVAG